MDVLATKAAGWFPEVEKSKSFIRREASKQRVLEEQNLHDKPDKAEPVYRQYIYDRVSGQSYLPVVYRNHPDHGKCHFSGDAHDNPTDWFNRPPHYLCYLPPCVRRCPNLLEQNPICECVGRCGFHRYFKNRHVARRRIFFVGFTFNLAALILTILATLAFSRRYPLLSHFSFSRGFTTIPQLSNDTGTKLTFDIGLSAIARHDPFHLLSPQTEEVVTFTDLCQGFQVGPIVSLEVPDDEQRTEQASTPEDNLKELLEDEICGECRESSQSFVFSCLVNIIIILRNMFSDVTRMYPKYDLNCPNFYGSLMATVSACLGIYTVFAYQSKCADNFSKQVTPEFLNNGTDVAEELQQDAAAHPQLTLEFEWHNGPALNCLIAATFLKIIDAICNYIVPTPAITRSLEEQAAYEDEFGPAALTRQQPLPIIAEDLEDEGFHVILSRRKLRQHHATTEEEESPQNDDDEDDEQEIVMVQSEELDLEVGDESEELFPAHHGEEPEAAPGALAAMGAAVAAAATTAATVVVSNDNDDGKPKKETFQDEVLQAGSSREETLAAGSTQSFEDEDQDKEDPVVEEEPSSEIAAAAVTPAAATNVLSEKGDEAAQRMHPDDKDGDKTAVPNDDDEAVAARHSDDESTAVDAATGASARPDGAQTEEEPQSAAASATDPKEDKEDNSNDDAVREDAAEPQSPRSSVAVESASGKDENEEEEQVVGQEEDALLQNDRGQQEKENARD